MKILFAPVSIAAGLLAGLLARFLFERAWGLVDDQDPPHPQHREIEPAKMVAALAIEGAVFRIVKGLTDHAARRSFARYTGAWPGEEAPERE